MATLEYLHFGGTAGEVASSLDVTSSSATSATSVGTGVVMVTVNRSYTPGNYDDHGSTVTLIVVLLITCIFLTTAGTVGLLVVLCYRKSMERREAGERRPDDRAAEVAVVATAPEVEVPPAAADTDTDSELMEISIALDDIILANLTAQQRSVINSMSPVLRSAWLARQRRIMEVGTGTPSTVGPEEIFLRGFPQAEPLHSHNAHQGVVDAYVLVPQNRLEEYLGRLGHSAPQLIADSGEVLVDAHQLSIGPQHPPHSSINNPGAVSGSCTSTLSAGPGNTDTSGNVSTETSVFHTARDEQPSDGSRVASTISELLTESSRGPPYVLQFIGNLASATGEVLGILRRPSPAQVYGDEGAYLAHPSASTTPEPLVDENRGGVPRYATGVGRVPQPSHGLGQSEHSSQQLQGEPRGPRALLQMVTAAGHQSSEEENVPPGGRTAPKCP